MSNDGSVLYLADGQRIRMVNTRKRVINSFVGSSAAADPEKSKPTIFEGSGPSSSWQLSGEAVVLQWPTDLDVNPVDDTLTVLDEGTLLKVSRGGAVFPINPQLHCSDCSDHDMVPDYLIGISYSPDGLLQAAAAAAGKSSTATNVWTIDTSSGKSSLLVKFDGVASDLLVLNSEEVLFWYGDNVAKQ